MRRIFACILVLLCSIGAFATSYSAGEHRGLFDWNASTNAGSWTPRIPGLPYYNGTLRHPFQNPKYLYPTTFSNAILSVTCNPLCAVGDSFAIDLTMSNFTLTERRPYAFPDLNIFVGALSLITRPIVLTSSSGIAMARFSLTGDLLGCTDATCGNTLFSLSVFTHGYARISYNLSGGQLSITNVQFSLPEPSSMTLLGTGIVLMLGKMRRKTPRRA